jgi:hypothetical protein
MVVTDLYQSKSLSIGVPIAIGRGEVLQRTMFYLAGRQGVYLIEKKKS